jgi:hypothetical protein
MSSEALFDGAHKYREEFTLAPMDGGATIVWAAIFSRAQLGIKLEEETLFSTLWTAFHPLSLSHEVDLLSGLGDDEHLGLFFDFDHFLSAIFGEENA